MEQMAFSWDEEEKTKRVPMDGFFHSRFYNILLGLAQMGGGDGPYLYPNWKSAQPRRHRAPCSLSQ